MRTQDTLQLLKTALLLSLMRANPSHNALWVAFVDRMSGPAYSWCRRRGYGEAEAEDLTEELLYKIWTAVRKRNYRPGRGNARGWIFRILDRVAKDAARKRACRRGHEAEAAMAENAKAEDELKKRIDAEHDLWVARQAMDQVRKWAAAKK